MAGGLHGANRLGGNSLSDLVVFGRRAGLAAAEYVKGLKATPALDAAQVDAAVRTLLSPFDSKGRENPYAIHADLQECMQTLVGIIRTEGELRKALEEIAVLKQRLARVKVEGGRAFNPGWHLALDLHSMLSVSEAVTLGALERKESRGGHTRDDYPFADDRFGTVNVVIRRTAGSLGVAIEPIPPLPPELKALLWREEVMAATTVTMKVWRGDAKGGAFREYQVPSQEGMVVLDVIHTLQATQARRPRLPLELQGGQVRLVQRGDQRQAAPHVHDAHGHLPAGRDHHGGADQDVPDLPRPRHRRVLQLRARPRRSPPSSRGRRRPDGTRRMWQEDVERSQEFRKCIECFLCQNVCHVIRDHPENKTALRGTALPHAHRRARDAPARHQRPAGARAGQGRARLLQHHQVLHRGVPRAHPHHRQRDHPAEGARGHREVRPPRLARPKLTGK